MTVDERPQLSKLGARDLLHQPLIRAHAIMDELDARIKAADQRVKRVFIESQNTCAPA